jgi:hypothetical protein
MTHDLTCPHADPMTPTHLQKYPCRCDDRAAVEHLADLEIDRVRAEQR